VRILFLLTQDIESPSGVGRYFPMARELARLGHKVTIAALHSDFASFINKVFFQDGVEIRYVAQMHVLKRGNQKFYFSPLKLLALSIQATWALTITALRTPVDIIHICKPHPMNSIAGLFAKYIQHKIVFLDCDDFETTSSHFGSSWQARGIAFFESFTPRHVHHVTTHNSFLQNYLLGLVVPRERITYIPNGVDMHRFAPPDPEEVSSLRTKLGLDGKKVVGFIGSLSLPSHPIYLLLDAFLLVHRTQSDSILLIIGSGEEADRLIEKTRQMGLEDAVKYCGRIPPNEIPVYYRICDVMVDPVYDDPTARGRLPLKLFESWISEVPFVTGDVGDRRLVLGEPPAGLLARPGDAESLAKCILEIIQNSTLGVEFRKRGLEYAQRYNWNQLVNGLEIIYKQYSSR
jgi:glycosyltransferase involved in cell wall biosynthesis